MEIVKYKNIKFKKLKQIKNDSSNKIYKEKSNPKNLYKIFENTDKEELQLKREKLELLREKGVEDIIVPHTLIEKKNRLKGDISEYINDSIPLYCAYNRCYIEQIQDILLEVSKKLYNIHNNNILIGDLHFYNIILDRSLKSYFIDVDSYGIGNIKPDNNSALVDYYYKSKNKKIVFNDNLDRLSFMLSVFSMTTGKNIFKLNEKTFDTYSEKYEFLNDLKDIYLRLKNSDEIIDVPYLYELIK